MTEADLKKLENLEDTIAFATDRLNELCRGYHIQELFNPWKSPFLLGQKIQSVHWALNDITNKRFTLKMEHKKLQGCYLRLRELMKKHRRVRKQITQNLNQSKKRIRELEEWQRISRDWLEIILHNNFDIKLYGLPSNIAEIEQLIEQAHEEKVDEPSNDNSRK